LSCGKSPVRTQTIEQRGYDFTTGELKVRIYDFHSLFASVVESSANEILENEEDIQIRESALRWKINAIPAMQRAVFQTEPIAAFGDAWGLIVEMQLFLEERSGKDLFGDSQGVAVSAARSLEGEIYQLVTSLVGSENARDLRVDMYNWAREHPQTNLSFRRRSGRTGESVLTARGLAGAGLSSVGQIDETVRDLSDRMTIYLEQIPKEIRWNARLLALETNRDIISPFKSDVESIDRSLAGIQKVLDDVPSLVESERQIVLEDLDTKLKEALEGIDRLRIAAADGLQGERAILLQELNKMLETSLAKLDRERAQMTADLQAITAQSLEQASQESQELVDHLFWRVLQLLLIAVVLFTLSSILIRYVFRDRRTTASGK
jgi:hypothetical protein